MIQVVHFFMIFHAHLVDGGDVCSVIQVGFDTPVFHYQRFNLLVVQDRTQPASGSLFEAAYFSAGVIEGKVEHAHIAVFGTAAGADHRYVDHVVFILGILFGELFCQQMGVFRIFFGFLDLNATIVAINEYQDLLFGLALQFKSVPA